MGDDGRGGARRAVRPRARRHLRPRRCGRRSARSSTTSASAATPPCATRWPASTASTLDARPAPGHRRRDRRGRRCPPTVDAAIDDAIAHLPGVQRAACWPGSTTGRSSPSPGCTVGEKITPIASAGLFVPSRQGQLPERRLPARRAGGRRRRARDRRSSSRRSPAATGEVDPAVLVVCRKLGIADVFRVNGPAGIAALGFGTESIPRVRKIVGPGSPAVTCAQVEMQRHGVATMMLLGPTESLVIADDTRRPDAPRRRPADRGRARHRLARSCSSPPSPTLADGDRRRARPASSPTCPTVRAEAAARVARRERRLRARRRRSTRPSTVANRYAPEHLQVAVADDARRRRRRRRSSTPARSSIGQHTPFSAANFVIGCPASLPTSGFAHVSARASPPRRSSSAPPSPAPTRAALRPHGAVDHRPRRPRGLPGPRRGAPAPDLTNLDTSGATPRAYCVRRAPWPTLVGCDHDPVGRGRRTHQRTAAARARHRGVRRRPRRHRVPRARAVVDCGRPT